MAGQSLGQWFIEVTAKGIEAAKGAVASVEESVKTATKSVGGFVAQLAVAGKALAVVGLVGTQEGARMTYMWQQLSRQIAAVVLPVFEAVTRAVEKLVGWMRQLDGAQQDVILKWGGLIGGISMVIAKVMPLVGWITAAVAALKFLKDAAGGDLWGGMIASLGRMWEAVKSIFKAIEPLVTMLLKGVVFVVEKIATAIETVIETIRPLIVSLANYMTEVWATTGKALVAVWTAIGPVVMGIVNGILMAVKAIVSAIVWVLDLASSRLKKQREELFGKDSLDIAKPDEPKDRRDSTPMPSGFEDVRASYARLQAAVSNMGGSPELREAQKQTAIQESIAANTAGTAAAVRNARPVVAPVGGA